MTEPPPPLEEQPRPGAATADLAVLAARFGAALRAAGLPVGPDRTERFARAVTLVGPLRTRQLYWCARATLIADPAEIDVLDRVFAAVFGGLADPADGRGQAGPDQSAHATTRLTRTPQPSTVYRRPRRPDTRPGRPDGTDAPYRGVAAAAERLSDRDFAELDADELVLLAGLMRRLALATPPRRSRRSRPADLGSTVDLRATLRQARRTGGYPNVLARRRRRTRPRRLVVLCDISGSMEPYARAMLQLVYCAAGPARAEVFTFATRLTRLTRVLRGTRPEQALAAAGRTAPDWSGGTRIAAALKDFIQGYGGRGTARGAVVLIVSDGWDSGDPQELSTQMARLSRLAYRVVWANPRTASPRYQPLAGGMAAAWPYCDAVVSANRLTALDELLAALAAPGRRRRAPGAVTSARRYMSASSC